MCQSPRDADKYVGKGVQHVVEHVVEASAADVLPPHNLFERVPPSEVLDQSARSAQGGWRRSYGEGKGNKRKRGDATEKRARRGLRVG